MRTKASARGVARVAERHQLIEVEALGAMDRAQLLRRRQDRGAAQVEHENLVADAVHPGDAAARQGAGGNAECLAVSSLANRAPHGPVDRPRAELRQGLAQAPRPRSAPRARSPRACALALGAGGARRFPFSSASGPCRKAILSMQRQPRCALTRSTMIALACWASSAKAPSTRSTRVAGAVSSGPRLAPRGGHWIWIGRA